MQTKLISKYFDKECKELTSSLEKILISKCKFKIGRQITIRVSNYNLFTTVCKKFLYVYDKNYKYYCSDLNNGIFDSGMYICKLDERTYMITTIRFNNNNCNSMDYIDIFIFGKKMMKYVKKINKITDGNNPNQMYIYDVEGHIYKSYGKENYDFKVIKQPMKLREPETIFFSNNEFEIIKKHIDRFIKQERFYNERQLLYKTGILLYGLPGTGKSSLIKVIASYYKREIININVASIHELNFNMLANSINNDNEHKYIIVFEDIDTLFLNRIHENMDKDEKAIINKLLQFLDSNLSPNNVIFIATTNHINLLDDALLREGRFDLKVNVKPLNRSGAYIFGKSFGIFESDMNKILDNIIKESNINEKMTPCCFVQSKLQYYILAKINHYSIEKSKKLFE